MFDRTKVENDFLIEAHKIFIIENTESDPLKFDDFLLGFLAGANYGIKYVTNNV